MRLIATALVGLLALGVGLGCSSKDSPRRPAAGQLQGKLDAALALKDEVKRDDALASVAAEASEGTSDTDPDFARECAREAVKEIKDPVKKDDTASTCARALARRGHYADATVVAKLIADAGKRDATLVAITKK